ncbi:MAG: hypothetical protein RQ761_12845 [Bacteroidales bacterium]|nr:hypothetical protein [Bacteroidales bacterium]
MKRPRRKFSFVFEAMVAIVALKERESLAEFSRRYEIHPNLTGTWNKVLAF